MGSQESPDSNPIMQDFIFGGIEADPTLRYATEMNRWRGIRHFHQMHPLDPGPGEDVELTVTVGPNVAADRITAYVTIDGSDPLGQNEVVDTAFSVEFQRAGVTWQPLIWDFVEIWQGELPGQPEGTLVHYRIEAASGSERRWCCEPNLDQSLEQPTLYGYYVDRHMPPSWAYDAVVYEIFVDRFAKGPAGKAVKESWLVPEEMNTFMGGDLEGITARLQYIADLGVNAIWLTPIFTAEMYHGYDTINYYEIDRRFGTKAELRALVSKAHDLGIRVILDFVANHTSSASPMFQEALANRQSPYRRWFRFDERYKHGYRCFFDVAAMPQFDVDHDEVRRYLCNAARYWLQEFDVDGYRLDYAAGPSHRFWSEFSAACREVKPDCWLFGEVTGMGDQLRSYVGRLDGCLDFGFTRAVRQLCAADEPVMSLAQFANHLERAQRFFPKNFTLPAFLDNHDMNRFLWVAGNDVARLKLALGLLFAFGGPPILYYGTEVGLSQPRAKAPYQEEARHPMRWSGEQNSALMAYTKALIQLRRRHQALRNGSLQTMWLDEERALWLAVRTNGSSEIWIALNLSSQKHTLSLPEGRFQDALTNRPVDPQLQLPARQLRFLIKV